MSSDIEKLIETPVNEFINELFEKPNKSDILTSKLDELNYTDYMNKFEIIISNANKYKWNVLNTTTYRNMLSIKHNLKVDYDKVENIAKQTTNNLFSGVTDRINYYNSYLEKNNSQYYYSLYNNKLKLLFTINELDTNSLFEDENLPFFKKFLSLLLLGYKAKHYNYDTIINIDGFIIIDQQVYLIAEYIDYAITIKEYLDYCKKNYILFTEKDIVKYMKTMKKTMDFINKEGLIFNNIENITFYGDYNDIKINLDFYDLYLKDDNEYSYFFKGIKYDKKQNLYAFTQFFHLYLVSEDNEYLMNYFNIFYFIYSLMRYELISTLIFISDVKIKNYFISEINIETFKEFLSEPKFEIFIQKIKTEQYLRDKNYSNEYSEFVKYCSILAYIQLQEHSITFDNIKKQFCRSFLVRDCFIELLKIEKARSANNSINSISDFIDERLNIYKIIKKYNLDYTEDIFNYLKTNQELFQNEITLGKEIKEIYVSEDYYTKSKHNVIFSNEDEKSQYSKYIEFRNNKLDQLDEIDKKIKDDKEIMNYFQILRTLYLTKEELRNIENKNSFTFIVQLILKINEYRSEHIAYKIRNTILLYYKKKYKAQKIIIKETKLEIYKDDKTIKNTIDIPPFIEKYERLDYIYEREKMNEINFDSLNYSIEDPEWDKIKNNKSNHYSINILYQLLKADEKAKERQNFYDSLYKLLNYIDNEEPNILNITL